MIDPGEMLGGYRLIERIGAGGMGEVWKAEDPRLGRAVAIKILPESVASDAEAIARMRREARTAAQLNHPGIATVHAFEEAEGRTFIVMELVEGEPLTTLIRGGTLKEADVCRIGLGVADALAEAHAKGVVHRDVKPDNIIVRGNRVKVLDFGIAKRVGVETAVPAQPSTVVTQQGMILGTVHYMSPEQALGKPVDTRTDLFSLGIVLYEAITGVLPFSGETVTETLTQIIRDEPPPARTVNPAMSAGLNAIIGTCLRKNREERYASAAELAGALDRQLVNAATSPMKGVTTAVTAQLPSVTASRARTVREAAPPRPAVPAPARKAGVSARTLLAGTFVVAVAVVAVFVFRPKPSAAPMLPAAPPQRAAAVATATWPPDPTAVVTAEPVVVESQPASPPPASTAMPQPAPAPPPPARADPAELTADQLYQRGVEALRSGDSREAKQRFADVLRLDPRHARAHFRVGEIALVAHDSAQAAEHFVRALDSGERLEVRVRMLCEFGIALARGERVRAAVLAREIHGQYPGDPDLAAIHRAWPGLPVEGREPLSGRWRRQRRP